MLFQVRRVIRAVRIPAPDIEPPAREQDASDIPEPGIQEAIELGIGDEVIGEGPVFGPQLLASRFGLLGMPGQIERLMMRLRFGVRGLE